MSHSKWATVALKNIEHHYKSLARLLVKLGLAEKNLKWSKASQDDKRLCPIIITRPD